MSTVGGRSTGLVIIRGKIDEDHIGVIQRVLCAGFGSFRRRDGNSGMLPFDRPWLQCHLIRTSDNSAIGLGDSWRRWRSQEGVPLSDLVGSSKEILFILIDWDLL